MNFTPNEQINTNKKQVIDAKSKIQGNFPNHAYIVIIVKKCYYLICR